MRISDWSSDVCSSDLRQSWSGPRPGAHRHRLLGMFGGDQRDTARQPYRPVGTVRTGADGEYRAMLAPPPGDPRTRAAVERSASSEEHTSELQSLMRISYAVFCLKKTKNNKSQY